MANWRRSFTDAEVTRVLDITGKAVDQGEMSRPLEDLLAVMWLNGSIDDSMLSQALPDGVYRRVTERHARDIAHGEHTPDLDSTSIKYILGGSKVITDLIPSATRDAVEQPSAYIPPDERDLPPHQRIDKPLVPDETRNAVGDEEEPPVAEDRIWDLTDDGEGEGQVREGDYRGRSADPRSRPGPGLIPDKSSVEEVIKSIPRAEVYTILRGALRSYTDSRGFDFNNPNALSIILSGLHRVTVPSSRLKQYGLDPTLEDIPIRNLLGILDLDSEDFVRTTFRDEFKGVEIPDREPDESPEVEPEVEPDEPDELDEGPFTGQWAGLSGFTTLQIEEALSDAYDKVYQEAKSKRSNWRRSGGWWVPAPTLVNRDVEKILKDTQVGIGGEKFNYLELADFFSEHFSEDADRDVHDAGVIGERTEGATPDYDFDARGALSNLLGSEHAERILALAGQRGAPGDSGDYASSRGVADDFRERAGAIKMPEYTSKPFAEPRLLDPSTQEGAKVPQPPGTRPSPVTRGTPYSPPGRPESRGREEQISRLKRQTAKPTNMPTEPRFPVPRRTPEPIAQPPAIEAPQRGTPYSPPDRPRLKSPEQPAPVPPRVPIGQVPPYEEEKAGALPKYIPPHERDLPPHDREKVATQADVQDLLLQINPNLDPQEVAKMSRGELLQRLLRR